MQKLRLKTVLAAIAGILLLGTSLSAQSWQEMMLSNDANFHEIQKAFNRKQRAPLDQKIPKGQGIKQYLRWANYWENRVLPDGSFPESDYYWQEYKDYQRRSRTRAGALGDDWKCIGPYDHVTKGSWSSGQGRVNVIREAPNDPNTIYVGTPNGGLWKSTDGGSNWTALAQNFASMGISGIGISPSAPNTLYLATGDHDGGDSHCIGVMKSTDGGQTWSETGTLNVNKSGPMVVHPTNANIVYVCTSVGLYRSTNGGSSWQLLQSGQMQDVEMKPGDPTTIYCVTKNRFYRSTNSGNSFTQISSGLPGSAGRFRISVTAADANRVYLVASNTNHSFQGVYRSNNSGQTFTATETTQDLFSGSSQAWFDLDIGASQTDADELMMGVMNMWKSTDGGYSWTEINSWSAPSQSSYTHADIHFVQYVGSKVYVGSDGGIYRSTNGGDVFTDLTEGIAIGQYYTLADNETIPELLAGGLQDNGGYALINGTWECYYGADGMGSAISPDGTKIYGMIQFGTLYQKTTNGYSYRNKPSGQTGKWVTPLEHDHNRDRVIAGFDHVYEWSQSGGWDQLSTFNFPAKLSLVEVFEGNSDVLFASTGPNLYKSTNNGSSWSAIHGNLSFSSGNISDIEVDPNDHNRIWITTFGYSSSHKVYYTSNGGTTWTNMSQGLPNIPAKTIAIDKSSSNGGMYVGMDFGVYYRNNDMSAWTNYASGLPNVTVTDLEVNEATGKIRIATYGRGVWESGTAEAGCTKIAKDAWSLLYTSSSETTAGNEAPGTKAFDDNPNTLWHTQWFNADPVHPHEIQIDMGANYDLCKMSYLPRQDGGENGTIINYDFYASTDQNNWGSPIATGSFAANTSEKFVNLPNTTARYIRLVAKSEINGNPWTSVAELTMYGGDPSELVAADFTADKTSIAVGTTVNFTDSSTGNPTGWAWTFTGGTPAISAVQNPSVTYNTAGTYEVKMTASNAGHSDTETKSNYITVVASPEAAFKADTTVVAEGGTVNFTDESTGATSWSWSFEGGTPTTSSTQNPSVAYNTAGTYKVTLIATSLAGNDTLTKSAYITVIAPPKAAFTADETTIGEGSSIQFTDQSTGATSWSWSFEGGDPSTSTAQKPSVSYAASGTYKVTQIAINGAGNDTLTKTDYVTVIAPPTAAFTSDTTVVSIGESVQFTNESTGATSWSWSFESGSPTTSSEQNPSVTYTNEGTFEVSLIASNLAGNDTLTKAAYITVIASPTAAFTADKTTIGEGDTVQFTDQSVGATSWSWSFEGGNPSTSVAQNPSVSYANAGTYQVQLIAINAAGNDTLVKTEYITVIAPPTAVFTADNTTIGEGDTVQFTDQSVGATSWNWSFEGGDPISSSEQNPSVKYVTPGMYKVTLVATNLAGNDTQTKTDYITVIAKPTAAFMADTTMIGEGEMVQFTDQSVGATSWSWSFEGGQPSTSNDQNPSVSYASAGTYEVSLIAMNLAGNDTVIKTDYITVIGAPTAGFSADETMIGEGDTVQFTNESAGATSWNWSFEGGLPATSEDEHPSVSYTSAGIYEVTLIAINMAGNDTLTKTEYITVIAPPTADFTADETVIGEGETVQFTDQSTGATSWSWSFEGGDPASSSDQNPSVSYASAGTFEVSLIATNLAGNDTVVKTEYITVIAPPTADFVADTTVIAQGDTVHFTNQSVGATSWSWSFEGVGLVNLTEEHPFVVYSTPGTYAVTLVATNLAGSDTLTKTDYITVVGPPIALFSADKMMVSEGEMVQFTSESTGATSWNWSFEGADPSTTTEEHPLIVYPTAGTYEVTLVVTNLAGNDTLTKTEYITVIARPTAAFTADETGIGEGDTVQFTDESIGATSWSWNFEGGNPANSSEQNPSVSYASAGIYEVTLIATNMAGNDTLTKTEYITVIGRPTADFVADTTVIAQGDTVHFTDLSATATWWSWSFEGGDPASSSDQHPSVSYATAGTYEVTLIAMNLGGNDTLTKTEYITVIAPPVADFVADVTNIGENEMVQFTDQSTGATSWNWSFEGGSPAVSTDENPSVTYLTAGVYEVTLTVTNMAGSDVETKTEYITVTTEPGSYNMSNDVVTECTGTLFDAGGVYADYSNQEDYTFVIKPEHSPIITIDFSEWNVESNDVLRIYDGPSTASPLVGIWSGTSPGTVIVGSGAMTLHFTSDSAGVNEGWAADWMCSQDDSEACLQIPNDNWTLKFVDSEEPGHVAGQAFDNDPMTFWHTEKASESTDLPHEIQIDLGQEYELCQLGYLPRQDQISDGNIKNYEFYVSMDGNSWTRIVRDEFSRNNDSKIVSFPASIGRYVRLKTLTEIHGYPWSCVAEFSLYGEKATITGNENLSDMDLTIFPTCVRQGESLTIQTGSRIEGRAIVTDALGRVLNQLDLAGQNVIHIDHQFATGIYYLNVQADGQSVTRKFMVVK